MPFGSICKSWNQTEIERITAKLFSVCKHVCFLKSFAPGFIWNFYWKHFLLEINCSSPRFARQSFQLCVELHSWWKFSPNKRFLFHFVKVLPENFPPGLNSNHARAAHDFLCNRTSRNQPMRCSRVELGTEFTVSLDSCWKFPHCQFFLLSNLNKLSTEHLSLEWNQIKHSSPLCLQQSSFLWMHWRNVFFLVRKLKHKLKLQCTHDEHFPPFKRFLSGFLSKCSLRVFFPALKSNQAQLTTFSATGLPELFSVIAVMFFLGRKLKHKLKLHCTHEKHFLPSIRFLSNFVKVFTENFPSELKSNQAQLTTFSATQLLFQLSNFVRLSTENFS